MSKAAKKIVTATEARSAQVAQYREVEEKLTKKSVWQRIKRTTKKVGTAIAKPFKAIVRKVTPTARKVARTVARPFVFVANLPSVRSVGRFIARNWGWILSGAILTPAFILAPVPTLMGATFILLSYTLLNHESWFVRAMGRTLTDIGAQIIANGVVDALTERRN